jgi:hypothetical protein
LLAVWVLLVHTPYRDEGLVGVFVCRFSVTNV